MLFRSAGIITIIFAFLMPKRTVQGAEVLWHIQGLREYLHTAERFRMKDVSPQDFTRLLPHAMVLGVSKQWAERFKDITLEEPDWYSGTSSAAFTPYLFASSLDTFSSGVGSAASSQPSSGGSSSGGSGFGGGGFSGGGGGGGGFGAG